MDERNRWVFINEGGRRVWGISLEKAIFLPFMGFVHYEEPMFGFANRQWATILASSGDTRQRDET